MSHFTVLVVGENVEAQLAPFQENNCGDCPQQYMEFNDQEDEFREEYETGTVDQVRLTDGRLVFKWDKEFQVKNADILAPEEYKFPDGSQHVTVPFKEKYPTFEEFAKHYHGRQGPDEKTGRYGYWENPEAKWDWYQVGGRWAGFLRIKPEFAHLYEEMAPNFSHGWSAEERQEVLNKCCVDLARKGHVDWEAMKDGAGKRAGEQYDTVMAAIGHLPVNKTWDQVRGNNAADDKLREEYWSQPRCVAWKKDVKDASWQDSPDNYLGTREQFVERARNGAISTFAFLRDGKWHERGTMGWFACVFNENNDWESEFARLLDQVPDDELLTVVDCHI